MKEFRVVKLHTGESFMCIMYGETPREIDVLFPLLIKTTTIPISENTLREVHSTVMLCPFTDDKHFTFDKRMVSFNKPLGVSAINYYKDMLNKHEEADVLKAYDLQELISEEPQDDDTLDEFDTDDFVVDKQKMH